MSEYALGWLSTAKWLLVASFATCYWLGGRRYKVLRRFVGGGLLGIGLNVLAAVQGGWTAWHLLLVPAYVAALHLGYGGDTTGEKLWRRALYGVG
ncbi:MAG: hypothetical protein HY600_05305, partial [Candidatus Omnitrophica bacterium]|nr:hypothetical protein [Candidatus Omnitrophota bacterium]